MGKRGGQEKNCSKEDFRNVVMHVVSMAMAPLPRGSRVCGAVHKAVPV